MHCKDISLRKVDFPLTEESIYKHLKDWEAYRRTEYLILSNGDDLAVVRLVKDTGDGLFKRVTSCEIVSLPKDTVCAQRPELDVLNQTQMAILQSEFPGKTVVIRGMFSHVNFVKDLVPLRLRVIDLIPPSPSKLRYLVDKALSTGMVEFPVIPEYEDIDLNRIDVPEGCGIVMFPCETSGATSELPFCFLDQMPELDPDERIALVGCNLSKRIFEDRYRNSMSFVNICPRTFVDENIPTIIRCCMIREGCSIEGNIAVLPWGTNTSEVVSAINALFSGRSRFLHGRESSTTKIRSARRPSARSGIIRCFA